MTRRTIETPGQRLSRQFWSVVAVIAVLGVLESVSHTLAVIVALLAITAWATFAIVRAVARAGERR